MSLDKESITGEFKIHPKTQLITPVVIGASFLDVDSTLGFPKSGELLVEYADNVDVIITYTDKTINQFLGCTGVTRDIDSGTNINHNENAYGYNANSELISFRINGVITDLNIKDDSTLYKKKDKIFVKGLGYDDKTPRDPQIGFSILLMNMMLSRSLFLVRQTKLMK